MHRTHDRSFALCVLSAFTLFSCGCSAIVIEESTLVLHIPADTDEIRFLTQYQGISSRNEHGAKTIGSGDIDTTRIIPMGWVVQQMMMDWGGGDETAKASQSLKKLLIENTEVGDFEYYMDEGRSRQLCAQRTVTLNKRDEVVAALNTLVSAVGKSWANSTDVEVVVQSFEDRKAGGFKGIGNLQKLSPDIASVSRLIVAIGEHAEREDVMRLHESLKKGHQWFRVRAGTIEVIVPVTERCARRVLGLDNILPEPVRLVEGLRSFASPVDFKAGADGLTVLFGTTEQPIRISFSDDSPHDSDVEEDLVVAAGGRVLLKLRGLHRDGEVRESQFLLNSPAPPRTWTSADGKYTVGAYFVEMSEDHLVTLHDTNDGRVIKVPLDRLSASDKTWIESETNRNLTLPELNARFARAQRRRELDKQREPLLKAAREREKERWQKRFNRHPFPMVE